MTDHNMTGSNGDKKDRILQDIVHLKNTPIVTVDGPHNVRQSVRVSEALPGGNAVHPGSGSHNGTSSLASREEKQVTEAEAGLMGDETSPFPDPVTLPTQDGGQGFKFDFNAGVRLQVPAGVWKIRFVDMETSTVFYAVEGGDFYLGSRKRHFMQVRIEVERDGKILWSHEFNARNRKVAIVFPAGTIGDTLGWMPYAYRFMQKHHCELYIVLSAHMREVLEPVYPDVHFCLKEEFASDEALRGSLYATYYLGLFFSDEENIWQPSDFRMVGLHRTAGHILGVDPTEEPPRVAIAEPDTRPIDEPYVAIAVQASSACKLWNNPLGWLDTVAWLRKLGYRVVCIDLNPVTGHGATWNALPLGVEDETGSRPLSERARWLKHADFFIGLSSGLSWLAWAVQTPVVMISGFTHPSNEFHTPYRVFSTHGCNSCWHDVRTPFQHADYLFCPHHKGTPRQFECTQILSANYVIETIKRLCADHGLLPLSARQKSPALANSVGESAGEVGKKGQHMVQKNGVPAGKRASS